MATYQSDIIKAKEALAISDKSLSGEKTGGRVLYATAEYVLRPTASSPTEVPNDVIELAEIPAGAVIVPQQSYLARNFGGAEFTVSLGDAADPARFGYVGTHVDGVSRLPMYSQGQAFFGYHAGEQAGPLAAPLRVAAAFGYLPEIYGYNNKLTFGIAYRVQG